jgi:glyoxylate reductase
LERSKVVVATSIYPSARERLRSVAETVEVPMEPRDALLAQLADADALLCNSDLPNVDGTMLARAPRLRVIASSAVGYDNIDLDACTQRGIPVSNARGSLVEAVADLVYTLILCALRRVLVGVDWVRSGEWLRESAPYGVDLEEKTLGIVGMGDIGTAVARRAHASGMRVVYHNRHPRAMPGDRLPATYLPFEELLATADCIVALVPLTPQTRRLFGAAEFARMQPTTHFVNASRGAVVDTDALVDALRAGRIAYAALDVTDPEPLPPSHPLLHLPNAMVTPHIGSATHETRERMSLLAAENVVAGLEERPLPTILNPAVYDTPRASKAGG